MQAIKHIQAALSKAQTADDPCCVVIQYGQQHEKPDNDRDREKIDPRLRETIRAVAEGKSPWPLYLRGEAGSGKTCASLCMLDHYGGCYYEFPVLCSDLRLAMAGELFTPIIEGVGGFRRTEADIWQSWQGANLAVLDDFAVRKPTDFQFECMKKAIDTRHQKPTVFISNLSLSEINSLFDDRIASRLSAGTIFETKGDRRSEKK